MSTWLELLGLEFQYIEEKDCVEPKAKLDSKKDHVVGDMTKDQKKLYTYWLNLQREAEQTLLAARYENDEGRQKEILLKAEELGAKAGVIREIFWISLRDEFALWGKGEIGVRKGFKVVWSEEENEPKTLRDFLSRLGF